MGRAGTGAARLDALIELALSSHESGGPRPPGLTLEVLRYVATAETSDSTIRQMAARMLESRGRRGTREPRTTAPILTFECANCGRSVDAAPWMYCSSLCSETASTVRYVRGVYRDGRIEAQDVAEAVRIRIAMVLGGGYNADRRRLAEDIRQMVFVRSAGRCVECGEPATEIDHVSPAFDGDINDPANLRGLCGPCHRAKTMKGSRPLQTREEFERAGRLQERIDAGRPLRSCDDEQGWDASWRAISKERGAEFKRALSERAALLGTK